MTVCLSLFVYLFVLFVCLFIVLTEIQPSSAHAKKQSLKFIENMGQTVNSIISGSVLSLHYLQFTERSTPKLMPSIAVVYLDANGTKNHLPCNSILLYVHSTLTMAVT
jgi:hypothetical protein